MGYKLTGMYIGQTKVRPKGWQPGANTLAYYPLDSTNTVNDLSGNNYNLTNSGVTFGTYNGVDCASYDGNSYTINASIPVGATRTGSAWVYCTNSSNAYGVVCTGGNYTKDTIGTFIYLGKGAIGDWGSTPIDFGGSDITNGWHNVIFTTNNGNTNLYIDGNFIGNNVFSRTDMDSATGVGVGCKYKYPDFSGTFSERMLGYMSNVIIENKVRTAQEISDYYNQTKGNYGL